MYLLIWTLNWNQGLQSDVEDFGTGEPLPFLEIINSVRSIQLKQ